MRRYCFFYFRVKNFQKTENVKSIFASLPATQAVPMKKSQPIGIFDSGIGGLTVARMLEKELPYEQLIYFGDTAHMPYGDKTPEQILQLSRKIVSFLISKQVKIIIIACNSASSAAASSLRNEFWKQVEIMGVIRPVVKSIVQQQIRHVGIIGTQATIQSNIYPQILRENGHKIDIFQKATPLLAPMIEAGLADSAEMKQVLSEYLSDPAFTQQEALLLACTHYPLIREAVSAYFGHSKIILDNAGPLATELKRFLTEKNLATNEKIRENEFYVSRYTPHFEKTIETFYGKKIAVKEIEL